MILSSVSSTGTGILYGCGYGWKWIGEEDGCPLLHCVFHNISDLKEAQLEMDHLINSIPGRIASYRIEGDVLSPLIFPTALPCFPATAGRNMSG